MIGELAASMTNHHLESVASRYWGLEPEVIANLHMAHREDVEKINRKILERWRNTNPGPDQTQVVDLSFVVGNRASNQLPLFEMPE